MAGNQLDTAPGLQSLHQGSEAPPGQRVSHRLLQTHDASGRLGDRVQVLLQADLLCRMLHLQPGQPAQVRRCPGTFARVRDAVAQQQRLESVAAIALFAHRVVAGPHQIAYRLVGRPRHAHHRQIVRARQARQLHRVASISLDAFARGARDR
jgi:hypothetical protein